MSIKYNDKTNNQEILLAGISSVDQILNGNSKNAIANKAVYNALQEKIEKSVNDLIYYYSKNDVYNKTEVRQLIGAINTLTIEVVAQLPTSDISTTTIYFVGPAAGTNTYDEYVYVNNTWVKIGDTDIDLSDYVTSANLTTILQSYYTKAEINNLLNSYYTKFEIDTELDTKQDVLTFDSAPTAGSNNPVKSSGIKSAIDDTAADIYEVMSKNGAKNLTPSKEIPQTKSGVTFTVDNDGVVTLNGTSNNTIFRSTISDNNPQNIKIHLKKGIYTYSLCDAEITGVSLVIKDMSGSDILRTTSLRGADFTLSEDKDVTIDWRVENGVTFSNTKFKAMIRLASDTDSTYQPYAETNYQLTQSKVSYVDNGILGAKNLLPFPYYNGAKTESGLTFSIDSKNGLVVSGSNTGSATFGFSFQYNQDVSNLVGKTITVSLENAPLNKNGYCPFILKDSSGTIVARYDIDSEHPSYTLTVPSTAKTYDFQLYVRVGKSINATLYPMIRLASDPDDTYQPYAMTNRELTDNAGSPKKTLIRTLANGKITATIPKNLGSSYAQGSLKLIGSNADSEAHVTFCLNSDNTAVSVSKLTNLGSKALTLDSASISGNNLVLEITGVQSYAWVSAEYFMSLSAGASAVQPMWTFTGS